MRETSPYRRIQALTSTVIELDPQFNLKPKRGSRPMAQEMRSLRSLQDLKENLLQKVRAWNDCPLSYRNKLYKKISAIDISKKIACDRLEEIKQEVGLLEFTLQLNPGWHRGVLTVGDEIVDQTQRHQRSPLITALGHLREDLGLLIQDCHRYHFAQTYREDDPTGKQKYY